jgi:hypothetical protein
MNGWGKEWKVFLYPKAAFMVGHEKGGLR